MNVYSELFWNTAQIKQLKSGTVAHNVHCLESTMDSLSVYGLQSKICTTGKKSTVTEKLRGMRVDRT